MERIKFNQPVKMKHRSNDYGELEKWISKRYHKNHFLVHTCTAALEAAALALNLSEEDEVIMPSYTFVATANAFKRCGSKIVFVDVDESMNIDLKAVEAAITPYTKVVVPVHYGGLSCDMDILMSLSQKYGFYVVEDAAQSIAAFYKNKALGTIGHFGCISFHHTKNIHCGEGGLLLVNDQIFLSDMEEILYHGTNQLEFKRGQVSKYTWRRVGSSFLMDDYRKALLQGQILELESITSKRKILYKRYHEAFHTFSIPDYASYNGHIYFIICKDELERRALIDYLDDVSIEAFSHYEPLHLSLMGQSLKAHDMTFTLRALSLLRLPLHQDLTLEQQDRIIERIKAFYE